MVGLAPPQRRQVLRAVFGSTQPEAAGRCGAPPRFGRAAWIALLLAAPAVLFGLLPEAGAQLEFDRGALAAGQFYRLITCHWTHWSANHLVWDLGPFVLLVLLAARSGVRRMLATLAASAVLIPAAVWIALPAMTHYRGLSGLNSALFLLVAVTVLRGELAARRWLAAGAVGLVLAGFGGKLAYELLAAGTLFADGAGFVPVPLAHLAGGLCGWSVAMGNRIDKTSLLHEEGESNDDSCRKPVLHAGSWNFSVGMHDAHR